MMKEQYESNTSSTIDSSSNFTPSWVLAGELYLNSYFFKRGILLISPDKANQSKVSEDKKSFMINDREFLFHKPGSAKQNTAKPHEGSVKKTQKLLSSLTNFALTNKVSTLSTHDKAPLLFNKNRREELFFPLLLGDTENNSSLYLYPWVSKSSYTVPFSGFKQFVSAGCLFGASMQGITQDGDAVTLINHHLTLRPGQKIESISYNAEAGNPFQQVLFHEFEKTCLLIKALTKSDQPKKLLYHLPAFDYIVFGLKLFIHNQISYSALDNFIQAVLSLQLVYKEKLGGLCQSHGIEVSFQSPFCDLFDKVNFDNPTESIISQLKINTEEIRSKETQDEQECSFTAFCLSKLTANEGNEIHTKIWRDFIAAKINAPDTIEGLFKIANTVIVATASKGLEEYETCSLLPLSEKQIQLEYESCRNQFSKRFPDQKPAYPPTLNLTVFEPVITYSPTTNGLLFYFSCSLNSLSSLIKEKEIMHHTTRNLGFFAQKKRPLKEGDALENLSSTNPIELKEILIDPNNSKTH